MNDIKGYEGLYAITENGEVWSYHNERFLRQERKGDYFRVELWKNGSREKKYVHDLVAQAFLLNLEKKLFVIHKDGNFLNNNLQNLAYNNKRERKVKLFLSALSASPNSFNSSSHSCFNCSVSKTPSLSLKKSVSMSFLLSSFASTK